MLSDTIAPQVYAVYVQLGETLPPHLLLSLERQVSLFPNIPCVLIVNHDHQDSFPEEVIIEQYSSSEEVDELFLEASKVMDHKFRNGFWKYTFERIFAILAFHQKNPNVVMLHIESDVLLLPNFPWDKFAFQEKLSWLSVDETNDVAALINFPNLAATQSLCNFLKKELNQNSKATDMSALFAYALAFEKDHNYLPSLNDSNSRNQNIEVLRQQREARNNFGGYFDPLAIGIWYFGQDPKNNYGKSTRYIDQTHHYLNAKQVKLDYRNGHLVDQFNNKWFSIHVHSKNLKLFGKHWEEWLAKYLEEATKQSHKNIYSYDAFRSAWGDRTTIQHFWHYLASKPAIHKFSKKQILNKMVTQLKKLVRI